MVQGNLCTRVTQRLRPSRAQTDGGWQDASVDGPFAIGEVGGHSDGRLLPSGVARADGQPPGIRNLQTIQAAYDRVVVLVESIGRHLETQQHRTQQLVDTMNRLTDSVEHLPRASAAQTEAITAVAGMVENATVQSRRLDQRFEGLSGLLVSQQATEQRVADSLEQVSRLVSALDQSDRLTRDLALQAQSSAERREAKVADLLSEHARRLTWLLMGALGLALLSVILGLVAILR